MKVIVKTLKNDKHEVELDSGDTVAVLKKRIEEIKLADADVQKLLHKGKILRDSQIVAETCAENDQIILMKTRKPRPPKKKKKPVPDENTPETANVLPTPAPGPSIQDLDAAGVYKRLKEQHEQRQAQNQQRQKIMALVGAGFPQQQAMQSLVLAKGDVELARSYLVDGVPPEVALQWQGQLSAEQRREVERIQQRSQQKSQSQSTDQKTQPTPEQVQEILQKAQQQAVETQGRAMAQLATDPRAQGLPPRLAMLMANPQMLASVLGNPAVQQQIQGIMARDMPALFAEFRADPDKVGETEKFQKAVFMILAKTMGCPLQPRGQPNVVRLSKEESDGITAIGEQFGGRFDRQVLLQAYMGNGRDLDQLRDFLTQKAQSQDESHRQVFGDDEPE